VQVSNEEEIDRTRREEAGGRMKTTVVVVHGPAMRQVLRREGAQRKVEAKVQVKVRLRLGLTMGGAMECSAASAGT
jgi:hypothetical protein